MRAARFWGIQNLAGSVVEVVEGAVGLLLRVFGGSVLVDARAVVGRVPPEGDVQVFEERVHTCGVELYVAHLDQWQLISPQLQRDEICTSKVSKVWALEMGPQISKHNPPKKEESKKSIRQHHPGHAKNVN